MTTNLERHVARIHDTKEAESVLRDWANPDSWSSAVLRTTAQRLVVQGDLDLLDPLCREKLVEISRGQR